MGYWSSEKDDDKNREERRVYNALGVLSWKLWSADDHIIKHSSMPRCRVTMHNTRSDNSGIIQFSII